MERVLAAGADVDAVREGDPTVLHRAIEREDLELVMRLLGRGADPKRKDKKGRTAYYHAAALELSDMMELIAQYDVN